jgi:hypothetical protein
MSGWSQEALDYWASAGIDPEEATLYMHAAKGKRANGHAENCDGWHHPITGHCGDCGCFTCSGER